MPVSDARWAAFRILGQVERRAAFASDLLHSPLTARLDPRDAALAEQLVLGVLRRQAELDAALCQLSSRSPQKLDPEVRLALRLGLYQIRHLDRIPRSAAVAQSVELVKRARKTSAASLVNAVLRKAVSQPLDAVPRPDLAVPSWLLERWRRHYGPRADALALATLDTPSTFLRLNPGHDLEESLRLLAAEGISTERTELDLCRRVLTGNPARTNLLRDGRIRLQDLGSQRIAPLLDLAPSHRFLDLCAAPGGKTFQALESAPRLAVAGDLHHHRLATMRRLAPAPVHLVTLDGTRPLPFSVPFDRILVDAPCSGTGTLARHPEIKWKLTPADLDDLAGRQRAILTQALRTLAPGGRLVYSTCSLEPEENEQVIAAVLAPPFEILHQRLWLPCDHPGDGFFACVLHHHPIPAP